MNRVQAFKNLKERLSVGAFERIERDIDVIESVSNLIKEDYSSVNEALLRTHCQLELY